MTAKVPWPTWWASVDNGRSILSHLKRALWRLSGICMPNLSNRMVASSCGPMKPRGVAWNGAGGWLIFSAIAAGELFPHRLDDLEATRDLLQCLGHILADLRQPRSAAAGAGRRSLDNDALVFDVVRPGLAYRSLAREGADFLRLRRRGLRGKLILARRGDEFFELQFQLLDQPRRAFGALPVQFAFELLEPQLEMRDQRLVV